MKLIYLILILCCTFRATAQKTPSDYMSEAQDYFEDENYSQALQDFKYIIHHYPTNKLYKEALHYVSKIYSIQHHDKKAFPIWKQTLSSGDDLYAHEACQQLCDYFINRHQYDSALHYLSLADTLFGYKSFCGNANEKNQVDNMLRFAYIYQKTGHPDLAISKLLPTTLFLFTNTDSVITVLMPLLQNTPLLKTQLDQAIQDIYTTEIKTPDHTYIKYHLTFLNIELKLPDVSYLPWQENEEQFTDKQKLMNYVIGSEFYERIMQTP